MKIYISDYYKDKVKALEGLQDEIEWHKSQYGVEPKNVYIVSFLEAMDDKKYKCNKNNMILSPIL